MDDIEIVAVQGEREWVLATVDADDDYGFMTQVIVPQDATPGDAELIARKPGSLSYVSNSDTTLRISAAPAVTSPTTTDSAGSGTVVLGLVGFAVAAGAWVVAIRRGAHGSL